MNGGMGRSCKWRSAPRMLVRTRMREPGACGVTRHDRAALQQHRTGRPHAASASELGACNPLPQYLHAHGGAPRQHCSMLEVSSDNDLPCGNVNVQLSGDKLAPSKHGMKGSACVWIQGSGIARVATT